jgi:subfamily B ATP-binding cassette protein MsbA
MPTPLHKRPWLRGLAKRSLGPLLTPLLSQKPAAQLIRSTARQQRRLIALNLGSSVVEAFSEGATLAGIFLAVEVLSAPADEAFNWAGNPIVGRWPQAAS